MIRFGFPRLRNEAGGMCVYKRSHTDPNKQTTKRDALVLMRVQCISVLVIIAVVTLLSALTAFLHLSNNTHFTRSVYGFNRRLNITRHDRNASMNERFLVYTV